MGGDRQLYIGRGSLWLKQSLAALLLLSVTLFAGCNSTSKAKRTEPIERVMQTTLLFGGDLMQHLPQLAAAKKANGYDYSDCFKHLEPIFNSADLVVLNLETTLTNSGDYSGYPTFASPSELAYDIRRAGVDAVVLANNHALDRGSLGLQQTTKTLDSAGIRHTGVFVDSAAYRSNHPLIINSNGIKLALLNYTYGTNGMTTPKGGVINRIDTTAIAATLRGVNRRNVDHIIIFFHWGDEYSRQPNDEQRELSEWCHSRGVELVIGAHPHVVQPLYGRADSSGRLTHLTAFSLGNLVSNQRWQHSDGGILLRITITHRGSTPAHFSPEYIPVWVHTPVVEGRRRYIILPPSVADTLLERGTRARADYDRFIDNTRSLLANDHHFKEYSTLSKPPAPSYLYDLELAW